MMENSIVEKYVFIHKKKVDIQFCAHDAFLKELSSSSSSFKNKIIYYKSLGVARKPTDLNRTAKIG
jgi:hypothetical protein